MSILENELMALDAEKTEEINKFLDKFIGVQYSRFGFWRKKIKTHEDVYKFLKKYPAIKAELDSINDKYSYTASIVSYEFSRMKK